jgi:peptide/nickel transport system permease protein
MLKYLGRKLVSGLLLLFVVTATTFVLVYSNAEDSVHTALGASATDEQVAARMAVLELDRPVVTQYFHWLGGVFTGDLGKSFTTGEQVTDMLAARLPVTLSLVVLCMFFTTALSVLIGVVAATRGGWVARVLEVGSVAGVAVPQFLVAIALVFVFAIAVPVFPATGYVPLVESVGGWAGSLVLPVVAILIGAVAAAAQQFRGAMIDAMRQDFVRTLRSRGISERAVIYRHVLRNAAGPGLTILALQTIALLGGVVLIEQIFALPGIGQLTQSASLQGDLPAVMGVVLFTVVVVVVVNVGADLVNGWINPKARLS